MYLSIACTVSAVCQVPSLKKNGRNFIDHVKPKKFTNFVNFSIFLISSNILTLLMAAGVLFSCGINSFQAK